MFKIGDIVRYSYYGLKYDEPLIITDIDDGEYYLKSLETGKIGMLGGDMFELYVDYYRRKKLEKICSKLVIK